MKFASTQAKYQFGFSLVELMVALTVGLLLLTGLSLIFVNSSEANRELQKTSQQIENGRYAIDTLSQDFRLAGFYGHFHMLPAPVGSPDPCEIVNTAVLEDGLALPVQGYRAANLSTRADIITGTTCDDKGLLTNANLRPGSDVLVIRRADTNVVATTATPVANEVYIQSTGTEAKIRFGVASVLGTNHADGNDYNLRYHNGTSAPVRKYHVHVYFVAPCSVGNGAGGVCTGVPPEDTIPTLKRLELISISGTTTMRLVPLVEGIEYLKIEYGVDNNPPLPVSDATGLIGDATVDSYAATPADWSTVIGAKVYVLARNTLATASHVDDKTYLLGTAPGVAGTTLVAAANDKFRRHVYTAAVRLMNTSGRREIP